MSYDLYEGHHHHLKLVSVVLLTKFGSHKALFYNFDPSGPRGPRTHPCKTCVAIPPNMSISRFGQNPITYVEEADCQRKRNYKK